MKKSDKAICLVIHSLQAGGMERVMSELVAFFVKKEGIKVHLVLYGVTRELFYSVPSDVIIHKPDFEFQSQKRLISTIRTLWFLRKKIIELNPFTILSFGEYWNSFVLLATLGLKYPVFVSDRAQPDKNLGLFADKLRKWLYPRANGVIAQTQKAKEIYQTQFKHTNIRVIGNPIKKVSNNRPIKKENFVLMVGRLIKSKNQDELIKLFARINEPGWKLVLVGYDHLKQNNHKRLQKIIEELGLEERVMLAGKQSDVDYYYLQSKIFAFTSSSEGFPNAIGEAMAAGLPVIAFDCIAGPSEMIVDGRNGFLIPLFNYDLFEEKLGQLMSEEELSLRMGAKGQSDIEQFYIDTIGNKYFEFITCV